MEIRGKVLVVDDSLTSQIELKDILTTHGYSVYLANSGTEALLTVDNIMPDLILLGTSMEPIDGFEVCSKLKGIPVTCEIPVVFVSSRNDSSDKIKGFGLGAVDFISKPFQKAELVARVKTHIQLRQMQLDLKLQAAELINYNLQLEIEVAKRKQAEEILRESEALYRTTLYSIGDAVITTDLNGNVRQMNTISEALTGYTEDEAKGNSIDSIFKIVSETNHESVKNPVEDILEKGQIVGLANHTLLISKDGTEFPIADSGAPIKNEKGELVGTVLVFRDQTQERKILSELEASEGKFRSIVQSSPMGIYFYHLYPDGKLVFKGANPAADRIIGTNHNKYIGKTIQEAFPNLANTNVPDMYSKVAIGEMDTQQFEIEYYDDQHIKGFYSVTVFQSGENFVTVQFIDISEQKNAELALKASEERFRHVFEFSPIGMSMTGVDGTLRANRAFCEMVGYTNEELQGKLWKEITHPDDIQESIDVINRLNCCKVGVEFEKRYIHKNGSVVYGNVYSVVQFSGDDIPQFYITTVVNITRRKLAEEKLRRSEEELKKAQHITHIGSWYLDVASNEVVWTEELYRMYGFDPTLPPPPYTEHKKLFTPESWDMLSTSLAHTSETGIPYELELKTVKKDGGNGWMWVRGETIQNAEGKTIGLWGAAQDISERKNAEQQLMESEMRSRSTFDQSPVGTVIVGLDKRFIKCNSAFCRFLGYSEDELIGKTISDVTYSDDIELGMYDLKLILEGKKESSTVQKRYVRKDGTIVWGEVSISLVCDKDKKPIYFIPVIQDINQRKFAEEALKESQEKFSKVFHDAPVLISITDMNDATYIDVNDYSIKVSGFSREEIIGHSATEQGWITAEDWLKLVQEIRDNGQITGLEINFKTKSGQVISGWVNGEQIVIGGKPCLLTVTMDITERKKLSEEILKERKLLRILIDNIPDAIYIKDTEGRKVITNASDLKLVNAKDETEVVGRTDLEIIHGAIGSRGYNDDMLVLKTGDAIINKEEYFQLPNGEQHWLLTSKIPFSNSKEEISGLVGIGRDITEIKKSNEAIIKLSKAIEQSPLSIVITNTKGEIEYTNPKFTEITGYSSIEVKGKNPRILKSGETSAEEYVELWDTISLGKEWHGEFHNRKKNGELYWESASISPIVNEKGEIINYIAIKEDISIQKELLEELLVSKEKAEESDRLKSAFLANMSHEIRTPLNGILGFTELLIDPDFNEEQKADMARLVLDNGDQLLAIINDVLDISKIESGQIEIKYSEFSVKQMINDIMKSFEPRAQVNNIHLRLAIDMPIKEINLKSDFTKIKQVLSNLLSNALKYTDKGFVEIGFKATEKELIFHVKDSGVGIPKEFREKIFDRFRHLEPNRSKLAGGNGLGLSISKSFVEMMGGSIWVESELGKGSCFYFTIPMR